MFNPSDLDHRMHGYKSHIDMSDTHMRTIIVERNMAMGRSVVRLFNSITGLARRFGAILKAGGGDQRFSPMKLS